MDIDRSKGWSEGLEEKRWRSAFGRFISPAAYSV
jgi:hypothetical protein